jgi:hypothetical protein
MDGVEITTANAVVTARATRTIDTGDTGTCARAFRVLRCSPPRSSSKHAAARCGSVRPPGRPRIAAVRKAQFLAPLPSGDPMTLIATIASRPDSTPVSLQRSGGDIEHTVAAAAWPSTPARRPNRRPGAAAEVDHGDQSRHHDRAVQRVAWNGSHPRLLCISGVAGTRFVRAGCGDPVTA